MSVGIIALTLLLKGAASVFAGALGSNRRCGAMLPFLLSLLISPFVVAPLVLLTSRYKSSPNKYVFLRDKDGNTIPMLDKDGKQQIDMASGKPLWTARQKDTSYYKEKERNLLKGVFVTPIWTLLKYTVFSPVTIATAIRKDVVERREQGAVKDKIIGEEVKPGMKVTERFDQLYSEMVAEQSADIKQEEKTEKKEDLGIELTRTERKTLDALLEMSDKLGLCFREKNSLQQITNMIIKGAVSDAVHAVGAEAAAQGLSLDQCNDAVEHCELMSCFRDVRFTDSFLGGYMDHRNDLRRQETRTETVSRENSEEEVACNMIKEYVAQSIDVAKNSGLEVDDTFKAGLGGYFCGLHGMNTKIMQKALTDLGISQDSINRDGMENFLKGKQDIHLMEEQQAQMSLQQNRKSSGLSL